MELGRPLNLRRQRQRRRIRRQGDTRNMPVQHYRKLQEQSKAHSILDSSQFQFKNRQRSSHSIVKFSRSSLSLFLHLLFLHYLASPSSFLYFLAALGYMTPILIHANLCELFYSQSFIPHYIPHRAESSRLLFKIATHFRSIIRGI